MPRKRAGQRQSDLLLLVRREEVDDAVDRLLRVGGVQRRHDEVAGLGGGQRGFHRLLVAHLAHEDDVGVLPHRRAQRGGEVFGVDAHLALVDHAQLVEVQHLDRVLDRHDVHFAMVVDVVDHAGQGGRLADAGRAGDEHETARFEREGAEDCRQAKVFERDRADAHLSENQSCRTSGPERVDAEATHAGQGEGEVGLVCAREQFDQVRAHDLGDHALGVRRRQVAGLELAKRRH